MKPGLLYQHEAAQFFRSLGLNAEVEKKGLEGARGKHDIDVWVTGRLHTFEVKWAVECKAWKTNVPKEKVLALQSIVQDLGADRGWLLSEKGFQAGAVHCARLTNITLASLHYLRKETTAYISETAIMMLVSRLTLMKNAHQRFHIDFEKRHGDYSYMGHPGMKSVTRCWYLDLAISEAMEGKFPVCYAMTPDDKRVEAKNMEELIAGGFKLVQQSEQDLVIFRAEFDAEKKNEPAKKKNEKK